MIENGIFVVLCRAGSWLLLQEHALYSAALGMTDVVNTHRI